MTKQDRQWTTLDNLVWNVEAGYLSNGGHRSLVGIMMPINYTVNYHCAKVL